MSPAAEPPVSRTMCNEVAVQATAHNLPKSRRVGLVSYGASTDQIRAGEAPALSSGVGDSQLVLGV